MRKSIRSLMLVAALLLFCAGCASWQNETGAAVVATAGTVATLGFSAAGGPVMIPVAIGLGRLGGDMAWYFLDRPDRELREENFQQVLEFGATAVPKGWSSLRSGHSGAVTPWERYQGEDDVLCRRFWEYTNVSGVLAEEKGVACRYQGRWKILEQG